MEKFWIAPGSEAKFPCRPITQDAAGLNCVQIPSGSCNDIFDMCDGHTILLFDLFSNKKIIFSGTGLFAQTIREIRARMPGTPVEVLIPDFQGNQNALHKEHLKVERFIPPAEFDEWKKIALAMGFAEVASGPLVRSSYHAKDLYQTLTGTLPAVPAL